MGDELGRYDGVQVVGRPGEKSIPAIVRVFIVLAFELALDLLLEDSCIIVRVAAVFVLVYFDCRDGLCDSIAGVSADATSRPVHCGGPPMKIPY